ncbi:MAG: double-strand break repair helicase AddA [Pseudomonadota bacterium]
MSRLHPSPEQIAATRPDQSNWVSANAGSGKTHVLTQRVARLLLAGADPQKVLCLTYTKAAASEMQVRLFRTLGDWAMADQAALAASLGELSGMDGPITDPHILADARRLFARALETPGGLKIQTIHAFCESLLRRFPLEAGISPRFLVADDRQSDDLIARVRMEMALAAETGDDAGFDRAAQLLNEDGIDALAQAIFGQREPFDTATLDEAILAHFGTDGMADEITIAKQALAELDPGQLAGLTAALRNAGGATEAPVADILDAWLGATPPAPELSVKGLVETVLTQEGNIRQRGLPTNEVKTVRPSAEQEIANLSNWALATRNRLLAARMAQRTRDLYGFAQPLQQRYEAQKAAGAMLDFDDLVSRATALLTDRHMRSWVLFKLDQGIDHILVDEAQDTSPQQWQVIREISEEFIAGGRDRPWSVFVVGDEKQSIYSFQGAEPQAFGQMRDYYAQRLQALETPLGQPQLQTSYRSAPAILDFVDAVFEGDAAQGLTTTGDRITHRAHRSQDQGRVDLWPLERAKEAPDKPNWWEPVDTIPASDTKLRLADLVAAEITRMIAHDHLPPRADQAGRKVTAGDILVLVSKRDRLARGIMRGLKTRDVPVAGADRLLLTGELAVKDLLALARVAVMPSDDLSLAALLRSPLCDVDEKALFRLAHGRTGTLREAVRSSDRQAAEHAFLTDMERQADFLRPYAFLEHALIHHGGRARLLARLGPEAEDPIDELLTQALAYERQEIPSLAGFIAWIEAGDIMIKRQMEQGNDVVRVMTVHGAKGLEAPIVVLPDTTSKASGPPGRPVLLPTHTGGNRPDLTIWAAAKDKDDEVTRKARQAADQREADEHKRLLYVALTRAEDWLILCGAEMKSPQKDAWYPLLTRGMARLQDVKELSGPTGTIQRFETGALPSAIPLNDDDSAQDEPAEIPPWLSPAPSEALRRRRAPSDLIAHEPHGGAGLGRDQALMKGKAVHAILERLSELPPDRRSEAVDDLLTKEFPGLDAGLRESAQAEAESVLAMPGADRIFGPDALAEVTVAIDDPDRPRMIGRIDRLLIGPDYIEIIDIKTDAKPPENTQDIPRAYLAQLGAYKHGLANDWPDSEIRLSLLWTTGPVLMPVPSEAAERAFAEVRGHP